LAHLYSGSETNFSSHQSNEMLLAVRLSWTLSKLLPLPVYLQWGRQTVIQTCKLLLLFMIFHYGLLFASALPVELDERETIISVSNN
jgi:hypothetical protein